MSSFALTDIFSSIWKKLDESVRSRHEAWHLVTLATVRDTKPEIRTLVLRGVSEPNRLLWMHTDLRSPKCEDVQKNQHGALLFYDPKECCQLRLNGLLSFDPKSVTTETIWQRTSASAKRCYQGPLIPGSTSQDLNSNVPTEPVAAHVGRENFTRLLFEVTKIDWLFLKSDGHVRAQWHWDSQSFVGAWVIP